MSVFYGLDISYMDDRMFLVWVILGFIVKVNYSIK